MTDTVISAMSPSPVDKLPVCCWPINLLHANRKAPDYFLERQTIISVSSALLCLVTESGFLLKPPSLPQSLCFGCLLLWPAASPPFPRLLSHSPHSSPKDRLPPAFTSSSTPRLWQLRRQQGHSGMRSANTSIITGLCLRPCSR